MVHPILNKALELKFFDRLRIENDQITIYKCRGIFNHVIDPLNSIWDRLYGGKTKRDEAAFEALWREIKDDINKDEVDFPFLEKILRLQGILFATKWNESLEKNKHYQEFSNRVESLQKKAQDNINNSNHPGITEESKRWIQSELHQRTFAALSHSGQLPYLYRDLPEGAILLTNVEAHIRVLYQNGVNPHFWLRVQKIKKYITVLLTGSSYIHASFSLGKGEIYEQDKNPRESIASGQGVIHKKDERQDMICPHDILVLNEKNQQLLQKEWPGIKKWIRDNCEKIQTTASAMLRIGYTWKKKKPFEELKKFNFKQSYACSAAIAAILAKWRIDVGTSKPVEAISPANFAKEASLPNGKLQFLYRSGF